MVILSKKEKNIFSRYKELKENSGSHSPSIFTIKNAIEDITIKVDACFLSNPYATDLFINRFNNEIIDNFRLREILEYYPSQNLEIGKLLSDRLQVSKESIIIGNGAIEIIQALLHNFVSTNLVICIPTFSSYYEFIKPNTKVLFFKLQKENDFLFDKESYLKFIETHKAKNAVLINPNNPNGGYINFEDLQVLLGELSHLENIIIDESFIHFAYESTDKSMINYHALFKQFSNVSLVKSMSKDFGIAGVRCGYGLLNPSKIDGLLGNGYLWNSNGISEYFFNLFYEDKFYKEYQKVRIKYLNEMSFFKSELKKIKKIKTYPSNANFILVELLDGSTADIFAAKMLINYGIYMRSCSDKLGLDGEFLRIASRSKKENLMIIKAFKDIFNS